LRGQVQRERPEKLDEAARFGKRAFEAAAPDFRTLRPLHPVSRQLHRNNVGRAFGSHASGAALTPIPGARPVEGIIIPPPKAPAPNATPPRTDR